MLGSLRQHELTEVADSLNIQLQREITERKQAQALLSCQKQAFEMVAVGVPLMEVLEFLARAAEGQSPQQALVAIHLLPIKIKTRLVLSNQNTGSLEMQEIFARLVINGLRTGIRPRRKINLGAVHVEQTELISGSEGCGLRGIDNIIRNAGHFFHPLGHGTQASKCLDSQHRTQFFRHIPQSKRPVARRVRTTPAAAHAYRPGPP